MAIMTNETPTRPFNDHSDPPDAASSTRLETDITLAARCSAPVLITAPIDDAQAIVQAIAAQNHQDPQGRPGSAPEILTFDPAAGGDVLATIAASGRNGAARHRAILWLKDVDALKSAEQAAVMDLLAVGSGIPGRTLRVIASSSVDLLDRVESGGFDVRLFYRLNTIHIVAQPSGSADRDVAQGWP